MLFNRDFAQCRRAGPQKNLDTAVAKLDGISEEINNHLFRKGQRAMGFSSALIGSGMAFELSTLKNIYNKPGIIDNPACDREVDFEMMKKDIIIEYIDDAEVYDEKVAVKNVFENQRRRWMESQLIHLKLFFTEAPRKKNLHYWNKLFINLIPPRIFFIALFAVILIACIFQFFTHTNITGIRVRWWLLLFVMYISAMIIAIPARFANASTLSAFLYLPLIIISYIKAAFTMKVNRKEFVHTPKTFTENSGNTEK